MLRIKILLPTLICVGAPTATAFAQQAIPVPSYQCKALKNNWNGQGPMPPPVAEYTGPAADAASIGIAMSTLIVDASPIVVDGRTRVIRSNGEPAWIDSGEVVAWHVESDPAAVCVVVRLPNGTLQTTSH